jgi:hypothetical protein
VQALFGRVNAHEEVVARATWLGPDVEIESEDEALRAALGRIFRPVPVVADDPSLRSAGTSGPVQLPPGTLGWFLAAARSRAEAEGLRVVFAPSGEGGLGWDPAGTYRPFASQVERMERVLTGTRPREHGEAPATP